jgi:ERCC4-type nuclease
MEIIVDDRERAVFPYLEQYAGKMHIDFKIQRNEVGDYAITYKGYILMAIERKTWADLSASFRDGRKENVKKLIELRARTGCQLAYLIEGPATPPLNQTFGHIPVRALRAHLDHLAIRDGIHMLYSKDLDYTAMRLFELASNYLSLKEVINDIDALVVGGEAHQDNTDELQSDMGVAVDINEQLLRCLPSVGSLVSATLAENKITLQGLYHKKYTASQIATLKYPSGSMIGLDRGQKLADGTRKLLDSNSKVALKVHVRILTTVPLISKKTAEVILQQTTLGLIMSGKIEAIQLANIEKTSNAKVGPKAAANILQFLGIEREVSPTVLKDSNPIQEREVSPIVLKDSNPIQEGEVSPTVLKDSNPIQEREVSQEETQKKKTKKVETVPVYKPPIRANRGGVKSNIEEITPPPFS